MAASARLGDCTQARFGRVGLAKLGSRSIGPAHGLGCEELEEDERRRERTTAWAWVAILSAEGLTPARDLVVKRAFGAGGVHMAANLVALGGELAGRMLWIERSGRKLLVRLVEADNARATVLGSLKARRVCIQETEDGGCDGWGFESASIEEVVLAPDGRLVVTVGIMDGSHCGSLQIRRSAYALPKSAPGVR